MPSFPAKPLVFTLFAGLLAFSFIGTGCMGSNTKKESAAEKTTADIKISQVQQYLKLGRKTTPGGQYVVLGIVLKNDTNEEIPIKLEGFSLRKKSSSKDTNVYHIKPETKLTSAYKQTFGRENAEKSFDKDKTVRPGFSFPQDLIFILPENSDVNNYELIYKPFDLTLPLNNSAITIIDKREHAE